MAKSNDPVLFAKLDPATNTLLQLAIDVANATHGPAKLNRTSAAAAAVELWVEDVLKHSPDLAADILRITLLSKDSAEVQRVAEKLRNMDLVGIADAAIVDRADGQAQAAPRRT